MVSRPADPVEKATLVRYGSIIKCTSTGATARYTVHVAFDVRQRLIINAVERYRSTLYVVVGKFALFGIVITALLGIQMKSKDAYLSPSVLIIMKSDAEVEGMILDFGVNRFDSKMIDIYQSHLKGLIKLWKMKSNTMS